MNLVSVSVVVATYKRDKALKNALESLGNQTFKDFEIILVDDNGNAEWNKKVKEITDKFNTNYPDMSLKVIVNSPNQGSAKARNIGIKACSGDYITFLDDDDIYLPEKIEKQYAFMKKNDSDYGFTDLYLYNDNEKIADKRVRDYIKDTSANMLFKYHLKYHMTGTDTFMFKNSYLSEIGGFDEIDVGDEFYLMMKAIKAEGKFSYLPGCDVKAYIHYGDNSVSSGIGKINGENKLHEYKKQYFDKIDSKTRRYIIMRHYSVLAFAGLRMKKPGYVLKNGFKAFFTAPFQLFGLILGRKI